MTVININNISGIASVNAQSNSLELFDNTGASLLDLNANTATFPGGISVGGTVTYDDVTNIDSVGIITARSGIHVTGGSVGIGTDNPTESKIVIGHTQTSTVKHLTFKDLTNNWVRKLGVDSSNNFGIFSGDTEHLRITGIGSVGISSTAPKTDVDISQKTGAVALPQGTTAQRPTGSAPYIRKNTTNNALEYFDGTSWVEIITDYFPTGSTILG